MRIMLTGQEGQLGFELARSLAPVGHVFALDREACDLSEPASIRAAIAATAPDVVVNAAAYTAVDRAEFDAATAQAVNATALRVIGEEAARRGAFVVHYSTDYVFDGTKAAPYVEEDTPNPINLYGRTKLSGEQSLVASHADHLILRTSWVVGAHGANFAKTMLRLAAQRDQLRVVSDQRGAPTSAALLADVTAHLVRQLAREGTETFPGGIYHCTAAGETDWHEYAQCVVRAALAAGRKLRVGPEDVHAIPTSEYPTLARRPANSVLDTAKLRRTFGLVLPSWESGISHVLRQMFNHD
jgi:dTDP-4-dehydrorhamnose reductase